MDREGPDFTACGKMDREGHNFTACEKMDREGHNFTACKKMDREGHDLKSCRQRQQERGLSAPEGRFLRTLTNACTTAALLRTCDWRSYGIFIETRCGGGR